MLVQKFPSRRSKETEEKPCVRCEEKAESSRGGRRGEPHRGEGLAERKVFLGRSS